jgi:Protein of unknown function (DUF2877)
LRTLLQANSIGALAARSLLAGEPSVVGSVVSAFPNSFYVKTIKNDLIFITNRQLKSPITINLDSAAVIERMVRPLETVSVDERNIHVGDTVTIQLSATIPYGSANNLEKPAAQQFRLTKEALRLASTILTLIDTRHSVLDSTGLAHEGVTDFVRRGIPNLSDSGNAGQFSEEAMKIVGLGSGFTPSGDDVLGGFLSTYNSLAHNINRSKVLLDFDLVQKNTNWISAKLMDYMQREVLDEQVQRLIRSAALGNEDEFIVAMETLLPRGHTSGIDISVGAILALCLISDIKGNSRDAESIAQSMGLS